MDPEEGQTDEGTWPEYEAPEGVPQDEKPSSAATSSTGDVLDPEADEAGEGTPEPDEKSGRMIPAYRLAEVQAKFQRELAAGAVRVAQLEGMFRSLLEGKGGGDHGRDERGAPKFTAEQEKLRSELQGLMPELVHLLPLADRAKDLLGLAERAPAWDRDNETYWDRVAQTTTTRLNTTMAAAIGAKSLDPETASVLRDAFVQWVKSDDERNLRYEGQDANLVGDFEKWFIGRFRQPGTRPAAAAGLRRAEATKALPRGGGSSSRMPPPVPKPKTEDDDPFDAVNNRAWAKAQDDLAGRS
jgi:hypothetical protein